jgi:DNA excision repair protein ERCC-3
MTKSNPRQAIAVCKRDNAVDIVVTDFNMPNMNGLKLRTALRKMRPRRAARFFTLVSRDTREEEFAHNRKLFLVEQGYSYQIVG